MVSLGFAKGFPKYSHSIPIVFIWYSYGIPDVSIHSYGIPMVSLWCFYVSPLVFPSIPMVFLWLSQVFLWYANLFPIVF